VFFKSVQKRNDGCLLHLTFETETFWKTRKTNKIINKLTNSEVSFGSIVNIVIMRKLCIHCKHFVPNFPVLGRCRLFPSKDNKEYQFATVARNSEQLCGKEGRRFETKKDKKEQKKK